MPLGIVNRMFLHDLALELSMTVGELFARMSAHELTVAWPTYFEYRERERADAAADA